MSDLGDLAARFLRSNQGTNISKADIIKAFERVDEDFGNINRNQDYSMWSDSNNDGEINKDEFVDMMELALSSTDKTSTKEDYEIIFDILNSNTSGKSSEGLDSEEYDLLINKKSRTTDKITSYSLYTTFFGNAENVAGDISGISVSSQSNDTTDDTIDETTDDTNINDDSSQSTVTDSDNDSVSDTSSESNNDSNEVSTEGASSSVNTDISGKETLEEIANKIISGESNIEDYTSILTHNDYIKLEELVGNDSSNTEIEDKTSENVSNDPISKFKDLITKTVLLDANDKYETAEDVITDWLTDGTITEEQASELRNSYRLYSDADEKLIDFKLEAAKINNPDITREEVISQLEQNGSISAPIEDAQTTIEQSLNNNAIKSMKDVLEDIVLSQTDDKYKTPNDVINEWLSDGRINNKQAELLRKEYVEYSVSDEKLIENSFTAAKITNPDITKDEVIEMLTKNGSLSAPVKTADTELEHTTNNTSIENLKDTLEEIVLNNRTDNYKCPEDVISEWLNDGTIDNAQANALRESYLEYSEKDEKMIQQRLQAEMVNNPNITREEVIDMLTQNGTISSPIKDSNSELENNFNENEITTLMESIKEEILKDKNDSLEAPEDVISNWLNNGIIDREQADELRTRYIVYSEKDEGTIQRALTAAQMNNPKITRDDIISQLRASNSISSPIKDATTKLNDTALTIDAKAISDRLYKSMKGAGTKEQQVENIINNPDLTSADFVAIIKQYNQDYGSLVHMINDDFSSFGNNKQKEYEAKLANALIEEVKNGNDDALELLCKEFYNSTAGMSGTCDEFIAEIFACADDEVLAKLARTYSEINPGRDIQDDIKGDYRNVLSKANLEDKYINAIINALANTKI